MAIDVFYLTSTRAKLTVQHQGRIKAALETELSSSVLSEFRAKSG